VHTYGPVPSRRLGRSLGVSIIPRKVCTCSCVYCQLGPTRLPRLQPRSYFSRKDILGEIHRRVLETSPDCITFVGDGEPTLSADLGWYIEQCKAHWSIPVAVITNGVLLFREGIRHELLQADIVLPSLDAGDARTLRSINRPHQDLQFEEVVNGLIQFRRAFHGRIRLEVMLVRDLNDSERSIRDIRRLAWAIRPDWIDIAIPTRPPAEHWVRPPELDNLLRAQRILRSAETMARPETGTFEIAGFTTFLDAVRGLSSRHPLRWDQAEQVEAAFGQPGELERLIESGALSLVEYGPDRFVAPSGRDESAIGKE
jgi:wyosine [tRNA(Phe)-imidazoG37] synthetase (radical SAM superfamily)